MSNGLNDGWNSQTRRRKPDRRQTARFLRGTRSPPPPADAGEGALYISLLRRVGVDRLPLGLEDRRGFLLYACALEEVGVLRAPQAHRVLEHEVAEIVLADIAVLDQLKRFRQRLAHVDHVEMPDIGAVDRVELRVERVQLEERRRVHPVVGLAAEIVRLDVQIDPVLLAGELEGRKIVEVL